ncbi:programmed cell death 1 ligand 1 isoform X2 [Oreochromis niloticus]|uniref:programmed cell death 1 ligand 1 isoform X2 n=1 Tax=Oreochromis niloticus TaxID=8128 RepID=UPI00090466A0|nr:programmed cell death 1 ligand 1 isoform X2 [Oreochromis niloticus]
MTLLTSACLCVALLFVCVVDLASSDQKTITPESGQKNVTLTCRAPQGKTIRAVKWSRADLGDKYVLLYRDELFDQTSQHPSFKNRVDLQDRQMKDGDVSLILKDVTINDAGTYECRVIVGESASLEIMGTVNMSVLPPGHQGDTEDGGIKDIPVGLKIVCLQEVLHGGLISFN